MQNQATQNCSELPLLIFEAKIADIYERVDDISRILGYLLG
jgi:hypothetical protein